MENPIHLSLFYSVDLWLFFYLLLSLRNIICICVYFGLKDKAEEILYSAWP